MIKHYLSIFATFLSLQMAVAQVPIFQSKEIISGEINSGYYLLLPTEDLPKIQETWQSFLQKQGRFTKVDNQVYMVEALDAPFARSHDVRSLQSTVQASKGMVKVFFSFRSVRSAVADKINPNEIQDWCKPFLNEFHQWQGQKLHVAELDLLRSQQKSLDREVARLQSSIERNLKQQNKLDQSIRQTPEELSKIISEKEALTQSLIQQNSPNESLQKESLKKEKDIQKLQTQSKRNEKQLSNKERALQKIRTDFLQKERERRLRQEVLDSKINRN